MQAVGQDVNARVAPGDHGAVEPELAFAFVEGDDLGHLCPFTQVGSAGGVALARKAGWA